MNIIFAGPSLPPSAAPDHPGLIWAPPAAQGDIYRAAVRQPKAIGLIDGYFSWTPAVWHKEILWAMRHGIKVYGASSMGALRAAELHAFGMTGVGEVFESFRSGALEDDDEVALLHGAADDDYAAYSEPMVNVRATLARAVADGVLDAGQAEALVGRARELFYQQRAWPLILEGLDTAPGARLRAWLESGRVDQKRADALALVERVVAEAGEPAPPPGFHFEATALWEELTQTAGVSAGFGPDAEALSTGVLFPDAVRDVLSGDAAEARDLEWRAVLRLLCASRPEQIDALDEERIERQVIDFRRARGLLTPASFSRWLEDNDLTPRSFVALMCREAMLEDFLERAKNPATRHLFDELRVRGAYAEVKARLGKSGQAANGETIDA